MIQIMYTRCRDESDGFTLIELLVVIAVIAVLLAIALPSFLGYRTAARDRAAQSSLRIAEQAAYLVNLQEGRILGRAELLALLPSVEPSIDWIDHYDSSTGPTQVSLDEHNGGSELALAAMSESGTCFYVRVSTGGPPSRLAVPDAVTCQAHDYQVGPDTGW